MIKATDLRIGNLVGYGVHIVRIKSIHTESVLKNSVHVYIELNELMPNYCVDIDELKPIQLSPKILNKCGCEQTNGSAFYSIDLKKNIGQLNINPNNGIVWYSHHRHNSRMNPCPNGIKYLHQLQNIIYILSSEELIIDVESLKESSLQGN